MKRRDFFQKGGCGLLGSMIAYFGLTSCTKQESTAEEMTPAAQETMPAAAEEMSRKDMVKKMLIEQKGVTEEEAEAMISDFEKKLPKVKEQCICKTCPTYVAEETELGFCHPLIGKSKIITEERGCDCPKCPVYKMMELKNGYYCTRGSEMELEAAKTS